MTVDWLICNLGACTGTCYSCRLYVFSVIYVIWDIKARLCVYKQLRIDSVYVHSCTVVAFLFTNGQEEDRKKWQF